MEICLPKVCLGIPNYEWNNRITYRSASLCSRKLCCWKLGKQRCFLSNTWITWTFCSSPIPQHTARAIAPVAWKCACQSLPGLTQITTHIPIDSQTHTHATSMSKRMKKEHVLFSHETLPFKNKSSVPMTVQHVAIAEKTHLLHTTWQGLALGIRAKNKCGEFLKQDRCRQLKPSPCRSPCPCQSRL